MWGMTLIFKAHGTLNLQGEEVRFGETLGLKTSACAKAGSTDTYLIQEIHSNTFVYNSIVLAPIQSQMKALSKSFPMVCFLSRDSQHLFQFF
jgi:hypothetical protein